MYCTFHLEQHKSIHYMFLPTHSPRSSQQVEVDRRTVVFFLFFSFFFFLSFPGHNTASRRTVLSAVADGGCSFFVAANASFRLHCLHPVNGVEHAAADVSAGLVEGKCFVTLPVTELGVIERQADAAVAPSGQPTGAQTAHKSTRLKPNAGQGRLAAAGSFSLLAWTVS
jgi:hypothetical protein